MPVEFKITGEDPAEAIKALTALAVCFAPKAEQKRQRKAEAVKETAPKPEPEPEVAKEVVPEPEVTKTTAPEPETAKEITPSVGELRALVTEICTTDEKKEAYKALLKEFNVRSATDLTAEQRQEFLTRLQAL